MRENEAQSAADWTSGSGSAIVEDWQPSRTSGMGREKKENHDAR